MARTNVGAAAKSSVRRIRTTEKTLKALELRKRGMNYTQIGEKLGCARSTACRYVLSELENLADKCREEAVHVRDLELQRLDDSTSSHTQRSRTGTTSPGLTAASGSWSAGRSSSGSTLLRRSNIPATS
jgi:hypothetical protein